MTSFEVDYKVSCKQTVMAEDEEGVKKVIKSMFKNGLWSDVEFIKIIEN